MIAKFLRALVTVGIATLLSFGASISNADDLTPAQKEQLSLVPDGAKEIYRGFQLTTVLHKLPDSFKPRAAPWQFCHSDSYAGNSWRANVVAELQKQVSDFDKAGLSKGNLIATNANGDTNTQLTQINSLVAQGCDVIFTTPISPTGLCNAIRDAAEKGVLIITLESPVSCAEAINLAHNGYFSAYDAGQWLGKAMSGKGNVLIVNGFAGNSMTAAFSAGANDALKDYPNIKVVGEINGNWTPSVAKTETLKFVATHPDAIDGVFSGGLMAVPALQALEQSGRPVVPVTDMDNECTTVAYMKENPNVSMRAVVDGGGPVAFTGFSVAARILAGQRPLVNTILYRLRAITTENMNEYYDPSMTVDSTCWADPKDGRLVSEDYLNKFFTGDQKLAIDLKP
jgi:ribose transport system substrate-binding protein